MYRYMHICIHTHKYTCIHVHIHVYVFTCICVHTKIHIYHIDSTHHYDGMHLWRYLCDVVHGLAPLIWCRYLQAYYCNKNITKTQEILTLWYCVTSQGSLDWFEVDLNSRPASSFRGISSFIVISSFRGICVLSVFIISCALYFSSPPPQVRTHTIQGGEDA